MTGGGRAHARASSARTRSRVCNRCNWPIARTFLAAIRPRHYRERSVCLVRAISGRNALTSRADTSGRYEQACDAANHRRFRTTDRRKTASNDFHNGGSFSTIERRDVGSWIFLRDRADWISAGQYFRRTSRNHAISHTAKERERVNEMKLIHARSVKFSKMKHNIPLTHV